jgi:hypothetical protein
VNGILLVESGELVNRWHRAALFAGERRVSSTASLGHNISCFRTFSLLSVTLQKSALFYDQFNLFNNALSWLVFCFFILIAMYV